MLPIEDAADLLKERHASVGIVEGEVERHVDVERTARLGPEAQRDGAAERVFAVGRFKSVGSVACLSGMLGEELPGGRGPWGGDGLRQAGAAAIAGD